MKTSLLGVFAVACLAIQSAFAATTYQVSGEHLLTVGESAAGNIIEAAAGSVIKVTPQNNTCEIGAKLLCKDGKVTITSDTPYDTLRMTGGLKCTGGATVEVGGTGRMVFGSSDASTYETEKTRDAWRYPLFEAASVTFTDGGASEIVLTNRFTAKTLPTTCSIKVSDDSWAGIWDDQVLPYLGMTGDVLDLSKFSAVILNENVLIGKNVRVGDGRVVTFLPSAVASDGWTWNEQHYSTRQFKFNVELCGSSATLCVLNMGQFSLTGNVTGTGNVEFPVPNYNANPGTPQKFTFLGNCTFKGNLVIAENYSVVFNQSSPGDAENIVKMTGNSARLTFAGADSFNIKRVEGSYWGIVRVKAGQTGYIGSNDKVLVIADDASTPGACVTVGKIDAGATVCAAGHTPVKILDAGKGAVCRTNPSRDIPVVFDFTEFTGSDVPKFYVNGGRNLRVLGDIPIVFTESTITGTSGDMTELIIPEGCTNAVVPMSGATLKVNGAISVSPASWQEKVSSWFDASKTDTLVPYDIGGLSNQTHTNDYPYIKGWLDREKGASDVFLFNVRSYSKTGENYQHNQQVYPYVVTGGLNGKNYVCFGSFQQNDVVKKGNPEARRFEFRQGTYDSMSHNLTGTVIRPKYAIMVFGSQFGGGAGILGSSDSAFNRKAAGDAEFSASNPPTTDLPFYRAGNIPLKVDGKSVDPTVAKPDGGWQILSIDMSKSDKAINAVGWRSGYQNAGGQCYAEIIFFNDDLTREEIKNCEQYLAQKWGLQDKYESDFRMTLQADGDGRIELNDSVQMCGYFRGTIDVKAGNVLDLTNFKHVPGDEVVPSEGRVAWFDPGFQKAMGVTDDEYKNVYRIFQRTNTGLITGNDDFILGEGTDSPGNDGSLKYDRRPRLLERTTVDGRVMKWIDFTNEMIGVPGVGASADYGNTMRIKKFYGGTVQSMPEMKQAFIVWDSSRGGGSVMSTNVYYQGVPGRRANNGSNAADPIWENRSGPFANVSNYLDNKLIGEEEGFSGRPEVLTVEFDGEEGFAPSYFGAYAGANTELMGEMIFFADKLSAEKREEINAYLMNKWVGSVPKGYGNFSSLTIEGEGEVWLRAGDPIPKIGENFHGVLRVGGVIDDSWKQKGTVLIIR